MPRKIAIPSSSALTNSRCTVTKMVTPQKNGTVTKTERKLYYDAYCICKCSREENLTASRQGIQKFLSKYTTTGTITRNPGSRRPTYEDNSGDDGPSGVANAE